MHYVTLMKKQYDCRTVPSQLIILGTSKIPGKHWPFPKDMKGCSSICPCQEGYTLLIPGGSTNDELHWSFPRDIKGHSNIRPAKRDKPFISLGDVQCLCEWWKRWPFPCKGYEGHIPLLEEIAKTSCIIYTIYIWVFWSEVLFILHFIFITSCTASTF